MHRRLFRQRLKATLVTSADSIAKIALDVVGGRAAGISAGLVFLAVLLFLLAYVPGHLRRQAKE